MVENPLQKFEKPLAGVMGLAIIAFVLVNLAMLIWGSPCYFQRLGSFWVALLILLFGFLKFILAELNKAAHGRGAFAEQFKEKLSPVLYSEDKGWLNHMSPDGKEYERPLYSIEEVKRYLSELEDKLMFAVLPNELLVAAVATLQWGYGDLFHNFVHGKGWLSC